MRLLQGKEKSSLFMSSLNVSVSHISDESFKLDTVVAWRLIEKFIPGFVAIYGDTSDT